MGTDLGWATGPSSGYVACHLEKNQRGLYDRP